MKKALLSIGLGLMTMFSFAQLSGTYTINSGQPTSGTNFNSFSAAFSALTTSGVNGPVTMNVISGTYNEQVYLSGQSISGASATNTITIQSDASNTTTPTWTYSSYPLYLYNSQINYVTIDGIEMTTTNTNGYIVYMNYGTQTNLKFSNVTFTNGYYQVYLRYQSGGSVQFENCEFNDYSYRGIYQYYSYYPYIDMDITGCTFQDNGSNSYPYAMYFYYLGAGSDISGNLINVSGTSGGYGIYSRYPQGSSTNPITVSNNIVGFTNPNAPYSQYALYWSYGSYTNIHHNTFTIANSYQYSRAVYMYMSSSSYQGNEFKNNIVNVPSNQPYAFYGYNYNGSSIEFDNNAWWQGSSGDFYAYDAGTNHYSFSSWQGGSGGANSVNDDPAFISSTNYTPQSAEINNAGDSLGYTVDFYGMPRSASTPDPGAIEFTVPTNNASISAITTPDAPLCADDTSVIATLVNTGLVPLTSCTISYALNGSVQSTMNFSGSLAVGADTTITLVSSTSFVDGDSVAVWSSMPNGVQDSSALFDTASVVLYSGLTGTYTVPGDFATLTEAASDVMLKGLCDDVTISISPGSYNEQIALGNILGSGPDATLTWESSTGDASDVIINYASSSSSDNYVVYLNGADYVTFNDVTIRNNATYIYGTAVRLENGAENNTFDGCHIRAGEYTYTGNWLTAVYSYGQNHNLTLTNNLIEKGGYGLYIYGGGTTSRVENVTVSGNHMHDAYYYANYLYFIDGMEYHNNVVDNDSNLYNYGPRGIYCYYVDNFNITGNYVGSDVNNGSYGGYGYPFYMYYCVGSNNPRSLVANNCINAGAEGTTSYGYYGVYTYNSGLFNFHNNSVTRRGGNNGYYTSQFRNGGLVSVKNNSFADYNNGYAMYTDAFTVAESENNNFYTNGANVTYVGSSAYTSLEDHQAGTGMDINSISTDPAWEDTLACITCNDTLDNAGTANVATTVDIDSNVRSASTPDIGAVEWVSPAAFTLGGDSTYCADEVVVEAGPAQSVTWSVNGNSSTAPTITLTGGAEATTYNVLVSIQTEYCGSASDNALITLVPNAQLDSNTHLCADETATLNPGGLASGSYTWSTGASTQSIVVDGPGSYTVTKDVMGCVSTATSQVTQSEAVEIIGTEVCSDDLPLTLDATIASGTSYAWSGGSSPGTAVNTFNDAGAYTVTATDAMGCTSVDSFEVSVLEAPEAQITTPSYSGFIYVFDASSSPYLTSSSTVNWSFGAGASPSTSTNVSETVVYPWSNPSNPASYSVSLEINNGCGVDIATSIVTPNLIGVEDLEAGEFAIFPNPANDVVTVATKDVEAGNILILDMSGRTVAELPMTAGSNNHELNISDLAAGSYIVKVMNDNSAQMKQLIVQ